MSESELLIIAMRYFWITLAGKPWGVRLELLSEWIDQHAEQIPETG